MPGGDRLDAAHPACRAFVGVVSASTVYGMATALAIEIGVAEAPARVSVPASCGGCGELYGSYAGTSIAEFALRAELPITTVRAALRGELAPALLKNGLLDIGHPAALTFLARYPLARSADDDPLDPPIDGHDFTCPAFIDENHHDVRHPVFQAFLARYFGRIPSEADFAEFPSP